MSKITKDDSFYLGYKTMWLSEINAHLAEPINFEQLEYILINSLLLEPWELEEYIRECFPSATNNSDFDFTQYVLTIANTWLYLFTANKYKIDASEMQNFIMSNKNASTNDFESGDQ